MSSRQATFLLYFCLDAKVQKNQGGEFPRRSLRQRETNPRPRFANYKTVVKSQPQWLRIRKTPLHLANREFKAGLTHVRVGLPYYFSVSKSIRDT